MSPEQEKPPDHQHFKEVLMCELERLRENVDKNEDPVIAAHKAGLAGLAFSGGGIRSATFNLGVLQALARLNILDKFDYLSTVSGGGYIGSWLAAWIRRESRHRAESGAADDATANADGLRAVIRELDRSAGGEQRNDRQADDARPEPRPVAHLREFSNYLTPRRGLWGNDTWTLAVAYLRNLFLTVSVLIGALVGVILLVRGAAVLYGFLLNTGSDIGYRGVWGAFLAVLTGASFLVARDLCACRSPALRGRWGAAHLRTWLLPPIALPVISIWLAAAGLWRIRDSFLQAAFEPKKALVVVTMSAFVMFGGYLGKKFAQRQERAVSGSALPGGPKRSKREGLMRLIAAVAGTVVFFLSIGLMEYWMRQWPTAPLWLGSGYWLCVVWGPLLILFSFALFAAVFVGCAGRALDELEREWLARFFAAVTKLTILFCLLMAVVLYTPIALKWMVGELKGYPSGILGATWAAISAAGAMLARSDNKGASALGGIARRAVMAVAPFVFITGLLVILVAAVDAASAAYLNQSAGVYWQTTPKVTLPALLTCLVGGLAILALSGLWSWRIGVNTFSLHALYGNRLVRAYLGASNLQRKAHPFIGFDPNDNEVRLSDLVPVGKEGQGYRGPYLIVNAAINLLHNTRLAWQKRKAGAFIFSPLFCGYELPQDASQAKGENTSAAGGYVRSSLYADGADRKGGISLGKAMTISGAAASPNMGYHSAPGLTFLMTVFNIRLGWWLPNTVAHNRARWHMRGPAMGLFYLVNELIGRTDADNRFVYVSDGGHFENLGLYELVRRRCRCVVVCDAEADANMQFGGLGIAIDRCRTDFGIPIDLDVGQLRCSAVTSQSQWHCAVGRIRYSQSDPGMRDGTLVYIKASLTGNEPQDVVSYSAAHTRFPHESTADQWFDESQFESYRVLGCHIVEAVMGIPVRVVDDAIHEPHAVEGQTSIEDEEKKKWFMEQLFLELYKQWYPPAGECRGDPCDHDALLNGLLDTLRRDPLLTFLDWQLYPDLGRIVRNARMTRSSMPWVPESYAELRAGFYFSKQLIQSMQCVYLDRELDTQFAAPGNRGWMNLFRRWSLSRMVRYTWSMTAGTYSARFQTFCEHHLRLEVSQPAWAPPLHVDAERQQGHFVLQPDLAQETAPQEPDVDDDIWRRAERAFGLDYFETLLAQEYLRRYCEKHLANIQARVRFEIFPLQIATEDPTTALKQKFTNITAGFAIVKPADNAAGANAKVLYLRIRPSMRKMGLARKALITVPRDQDGIPYEIAIETLKPISLGRQPDATWRHRVYLEIQPMQQAHPEHPRQRWLEMINQEIRTAASAGVLSEDDADQATQ